jgi:mannose-1-phosphate guanylyltransferase
MKKETNQAWAILLAGGEGTRLSALTRKITGDTTPKQFCRLIGNESLFEQTHKRVSLLIEQDRIISALTRSHERFYKSVLEETMTRNLVVQPRNRGTAPAILYSLLRLTELDPCSRVALFPCDHFVDDDSEFMRHVKVAFDAIDRRPELTILLGIAAERPETSYGWIEPGQAISDGVCSIRRFWEKPQKELASELHRRGCLWNSFVMVARASTLLGLFAVATPKLYSSFKKVRGAFGTKFEQRAIEQLYEQLPASSFSDDILMHGGNLGVLRVSGVLWNDLGEPVRLIETLARLGVRLEWPAA